MGAYDAFLAFSDPCNLDSNPGWPLRNLLLLAAARWHVTEIKVRRNKFSLFRCDGCAYAARPATPTHAAAAKARLPLLLLYCAM